MSAWLTITFLLLWSWPTIFAGPKIFDREENVLLGSGSTFKISAGWSFDSDASKLISPEGDLIVYLLEKPAEKNLEALATRSWQAIDPSFKFTVEQKLSMPTKDGWEEIYVVMYKLPSVDNRTVAAEIRVFKGKAYVILIRSANETLEKRQAQLDITTDSWRPKDLRPENLRLNKIKLFSSTDALEMDRFIEKAMIDLKVPGSSVAIVQGGQVVYRKSFGVKKLGSSDRVTPDTLFMIGSTTKPLTTLMLARLVDARILSWDTPIQKILPGFTLANKALAAQFLIKHTACACTGMPRTDAGFLFGSKNDSVNSAILKFKDANPTTGFGETFQYSNHLVAIGGLAGAQAYNKGTDLLNKYETVMQDMVFNPLGMTATRVRPKPSDSGSLASPHADGFTGEVENFSQEVDDFAYSVAPAGSVWSNIDDLAKYVIMELNQGKSAVGDQFITRDQLNKRRTSGVKVNDKSSYGLGLFLEELYGIPTIGHDGAMFGFTHGLFFLPEHNLGMIVQINIGGVNGFKGALRQRLFEMLLGATPRAEELLAFSKQTRIDMADFNQKSIEIRPEKLSWLTPFIGEYRSDKIGSLTILKKDKDYYLRNDKWESRLGTLQESNGVKEIALISAPWSGTVTLRAEDSALRKLIFNDGQESYEFRKLK